MSMSQGVRRRSREMALQLLFQLNFQNEGASKTIGENEAGEMLRRFIADFEVEKDVATYGGLLFLGICAHVAEIDSWIQKHSAHWKVNRMGLVDLSVMRVAVYEMRFMAEPLNPKIAIDEAVEIAKKYGSTESGAFVNGILDHVARTL